MSSDTVIERREQAPVYWEFLSHFNHIHVLIFVLPGAPLPKSTLHLLEVLGLHVVVNVWSTSCRLRNASVRQTGGLSLNASI